MDNWMKVIDVQNILKSNREKINDKKIEICKGQKVQYWFCAFLLMASSQNSLEFKKWNCKRDFVNAFDFVKFLMLKKEYF